MRPQACQRLPICQSPDVTDDDSDARDHDAHADAGASAGEQPDSYELDLAAYPHDALFKSAFSSPDEATKFFRGRLPASIARACLWPTLTRWPTSFVKRSLQQAHSDLSCS